MVVDDTFALSADLILSWPLGLSQARNKTGGVEKSLFKMLAGPNKPTANGPRFETLQQAATPPLQGIPAASHSRALRDSYVQVCLLLSVLLVKKVLIHECGRLSSS